MTESPFGLDDQSQHLDEAVQGIVQAASGNWAELVYTFCATVGTDSSSLQVLFEDGSSTSESVPMSVPDAMDDLRHSMYQEGMGTWFTATIKIDRALKYTTDFDYDSEPEFVPQISPGSFAEDLEHFPRDEGNIPAWLRQKLAEAEANG